MKRVISIILCFNLLFTVFPIYGENIIIEPLVSDDNVCLECFAIDEHLENCSYYINNACTCNSEEHLENCSLYEESCFCENNVHTTSCIYYKEDNLDVICTCNLDIHSMDCPLYQEEILDEIEDKIDVETEDANVSDEKDLENNSEILEEDKDNLTENTEEENCICGLEIHSENCLLYEVKDPIYSVDEDTKIVEDELAEDSTQNEKDIELVCICGEIVETHLEDCPLYEEIIVEESPFDILMEIDNLDELYAVLLNMIEDIGFDILTEYEIKLLYDKVLDINQIENYEYFEDLVDTLQYLAGDYELNDAQILADIIWDGTITAQTLTGTQTILLTGDATHWVTGTVTIGANADITIIGSGLIRRGSETVKEIFNIYDSGKLTIIGDSDTDRIQINGKADKDNGNSHATEDKTVIRCDNYLYLENVDIFNQSTAVVRDFTDTTTSNSVDTYAGGAITLLDGNNDVTIKNCKFYDNTALNGAGIYLCRTGSGTLTIEDTIFDNCDVTGSGGAIYFDGKPSDGETIPSNGYLNYTVIMNNIIIQNCNSAGCGSAIYMHNRGKANITMIGCTIQNCVSKSSSCGTIRSDGNGRYKLIVDNCLIQNNESTSGHGAGIYWNALGEGASLIIRNNTRILNNVAGAQGGGVFVEGSSITITDTIISGNKAVMGGGIGIKTFADTSFTTEDGVTGTSFNLELGDGVIVENNIATSMGGGISYNIVDGIPVDGFVFNYTNNGAIIRNNVVCSEGMLSGTPDGIGGGIAIINGLVNKSYDVNTFMNSGVVSENKALNGGGFYINIGDFKMTGGSIESHSVVGDGGGIYIDDGKAVIESGSIKDNNARIGGALHAVGGSVVVGVRNCDNGVSHNHPIIKNNIAEDGGALSVSAGKIDIYCGLICDNSVENNGGAVLINGGNIDIYNGTIRNNDAENNGGAIYIGSDSQNVIMNIYDGDILYNTANNHGGAIGANIHGDYSLTLNIGKEECLSQNKSIHIDSSCPFIANNTATKFGGAFCLHGNTDKLSVNLYCGEIVNNSAIRNYGSNSLKQNGGLITVYGGDIDPGIMVGGGSYIDNRIDAEQVYFNLWSNYPGGPSEPTVIDVTRGVTFVFPSDTYEWEGHILSGWASQPDTKGLYVPVQGEYVVDDETEEFLDFYAVWDAQTSYVVYIPERIVVDARLGEYASELQADVNYFKKDSLLSIYLESDFVLEGETTQDRYNYFVIANDNGIEKEIYSGDVIAWYKYNYRESTPFSVILDVIPEKEDNYKGYLTFTIDYSEIVDE